LKDPEVVKFYRAQGLEIVDRGSQDFRALVQRELDQWKLVITRNEIAVE
jgi:tripartite-type tricarboxylate transporter receptor subunit TctC